MKEKMSSALKLVSKESKKNKNKQKIISRKHCRFNLYLHLIIIKKSYQHKEYLESLITISTQQTSPQKLAFIMELYLPLSRASA